MYPSLPPLGEDIFFILLSQHKFPCVFGTFWWIEEIAFSVKNLYLKLSKKKKKGGGNLYVIFGIFTVDWICSYLPLETIQRAIWQSDTVGIPIVSAFLLLFLWGTLPAYAENCVLPLHSDPPQSSPCPWGLAVQSVHSSLPLFPCA